MDGVELLLANGAAINARDDFGWTPLHYAMRNGHKDVADLLRRRGGRDLAGTEVKQIQLEVGRCNLPAVKALLKADPDIASSRDSDWHWTPLHRAAIARCTEIAKLLLANGAEVNARDADRVTPLQWAAKSGSLDMVELLLPTRLTSTPRIN
jgi:ankyrin repeat protein